MSLQQTTMDEAEQQRLLDSIPKMRDFENNLENIQPLKRGRRSHTLVALSQKSEDEKRRMIENERDQFENELKHLDEMDDPLDVYLRYLQWTEETFPSGNSRESELEDLYKRASFAFETDSQYTSDARYLTCWLHYARWVDTKQVFVHLAKLGIGRNLALYYEQYSLFYEGLKRYDEARNILDAGIKQQQNAGRSTTRLKTYLENFNKRIEYKLHLQQISDRSTPTHSGERMVLGHKLHSRDTQSMSQNTFNNVQNSSGSNHIHLSKRSFGNPTTSTPSASTAQQRTSTKFQVFTDHQEESASSPSSSSSSSPSLDTIFSSASASASINTSMFDLSRHRQENSVPIEQFSGAKLPQKSELVTRPSIPKIDVFRDDASPPPSSSSSKHLHQMEMNNNRDISSIHHRTSTTKISIDKRHSQQRYENNNIRLSRSSSASQLSHIGSDKEEHLAFLNRRYNNMKNNYIQSQDSAGNPEIIAALTECLGHSGPMTLMNPISFEELRAVKQVNRQGKPQVILGKVPKAISEAIISYRIGQGREPTKEYTAETLGAMQSIGAILNKRRDDDDIDDDGDNDDVKRARRTYVDENS